MSKLLMRCAVTGVPINDPSVGIWEDGEWVSWTYINEYLELEERRSSKVETPGGAIIERQPTAVEPQGAELLTLLIEAITHSGRSMNSSPLWGRIGELYVAERFGVKLSRPHTQGHDGRLGDDLVEIKTITPTKKAPFVSVKRAGNFGYLAVVLVDSHYRLDARLIPRKQLPEGEGGRTAIVSWKTACRVGLSSAPCAQLPKRGR
jgi:hypothetical protein